MKRTYFVCLFICLTTTFLLSKSNPVHAVSAQASSTVTVLHGFEFKTGESPVGDLIFDPTGNIYGTTTSGGLVNPNCESGCGVVFELSPSGGGWTYAVIYSFTGGADGGEPDGRLTLDSEGNLYGTANLGGTVNPDYCPSAGCGTAFELSPSGGQWAFTLLHSFSGPDGSSPYTGLTRDSSGNLYGTTFKGGSAGAGTVFELSSSGGGWTFLTLYALSGYSDGQLPASDLVIDGNGNIYGAAQQGGSSESSCSNYCGTVFELSPSGDTWQFSLLYAFMGAKFGDGGLPWGSLTLDSEGNLYGTTFEGGTTCDCGTVFQLSQAAGTWKEQILYRFSGPDGRNPLGGLTMDKAGDLYGTTLYGGTSCSECGTVFGLTPDVKGGGWNFSSLYSFTDGADGGEPVAGVIANASGDLYGTTTVPGGLYDGTLFELSFLSATTTALSSSPNPSNLGQSVTFIVTVTSQGSSTPTGTITFSDGSTTLGTSPLSGGMAALSTAALAVGLHSINAVYSGDGNFGSSSASLNQAVNQASTTLMLTSSVNPSGLDSPVTFTAAITPQYGGQTSGTVTFKDGATTLGSVAVSGNTASLTTSGLARGTHSITATYSGDSNFTGSTSNTVSQVVTKATTTTTLLSSVNPSVQGKPVTFTASVSSLAGTPTGKVQFLNGTKVLATVTLTSGSAKYTTSTLPPGTNIMTAVYLGDSNNNGSTSAPVNQFVLAATTTTLKSSPNPSVYGQTVVFTATVTPALALHPMEKLSPSSKARPYWEREG